MVEHLDEVGTFNCRVPLLPELWGRDDGFPSIKKGRFIRSKHVKNHSVHVLARLCRLAVDDNVCQFGVERCPRLPLWWRRGFGGKRDMLPISRVVRSEQLAKVVLCGTQCIGPRLTESVIVSETVFLSYMRKGK